MAQQSVPYGKKNRHCRNKDQQDPLPPPGFTYVETKILVPVSQPTPSPRPPGPSITKTYVNNYIVQGPTPSMSSNMSGVQTRFQGFGKPTNAWDNVIKASVKWEMVTVTTASRFADRALVAGHEGHDGSPLWVIRSQHGRDLIPGKFAAKYNQAFIAFGGQEHRVQSIELLCARPEHVRWVSASNGSVPHNAVAGGKTAAGEVLYVGRAPHKNSLTPGKVQRSHACLYISFGGAEIAIKTYEVLCTV